MSDRDYLVYTPDRRKKVQWCHVNLLKSYHLSHSVSEEKGILPSVGSHKLGSVRPVATVGVVSSEDFDVPSEPILTGRLNNSAYLNCLDSQLSYLSDTQQLDVVQLLHSHLSVFSDTPSVTNLIEHGIEGGEARPVNQHPYRMPVGKRQQMEKEVEYMLEHGIAEPACSSWASPCLLADKADGSDRFCTDFRKVNAVTKPDVYPASYGGLHQSGGGCKICDQAGPFEGVLAGAIDS